MNVFRPLALLCCFLLSAVAHADEAEIRKAVNDMLGGDGGIVSITRTPYGGMYEVFLKSGEVAYSDEKGTYVMLGQLIDLKRKANYTAERTRVLNKINFADLPLDNAVKMVRGTGKRVLVTFEDPNCGYCKRLAKEIQGMKDVTVYTFLYPILAPDSAEKSKAIWCAKDRAKAWTDWMVEGKVPASAECKNPVEQVTALGQKLHINGTPTLFLADGSRIGGMVSAVELEKLLATTETKTVVK